MVAPITIKDKKVMQPLVVIPTTRYYTCRVIQLPNVYLQVVEMFAACTLISMQVAREQLCGGSPPGRVTGWLDEWRFNDPKSTTCQVSHLFREWTLPYPLPPYSPTQKKHSIITGVRGLEWRGGHINELYQKSFLTGTPFSSHHVGVQSSFLSRYF